jgi:hypothetical protein
MFSSYFFGKKTDLHNIWAIHGLPCKPGELSFSIQKISSRITARKLTGERLLYANIAACIKHLHHFFTKIILIHILKSCNKLPESTSPAALVFTNFETRYYNRFILLHYTYTEDLWKLCVRTRLNYSRTSLYQTRLYRIPGYFEVVPRPGQLP